MATVAVVLSCPFCSKLHPFCVFAMVSDSNWLSFDPQLPESVCNECLHSLNVPTFLGLGMTTDMDLHHLIRDGGVRTW